MLADGGSEGTQAVHAGGGRLRAREVDDSTVAEVDEMFDGETDSGRVIG